MALIRGLKADYPCPICYIKQEDQADFTEMAELRTSRESQATIRKGRTLNAEKREKLLQSNGLRNVDVCFLWFPAKLSEIDLKCQNVFWKIAYSDPHQALSFEHLHSYSLGLWGKHLFGRIKKHIERLSGRAGGQLDQL
jgi:hypothetical protein